MNKSVFHFKRIRKDQTASVSTECSIGFAVLVFLILLVLVTSGKLSSEELQMLVSAFFKHS